VTEDAIEIRQFRESDLEAIVEFSLRAWQPIFASVREVLGDDIFLRSHPDCKADLSKAQSKSLPASRCWQADLLRTAHPKMRKDVREFIRRLEAVGLTVESTPGHYRVLRDGKPLRKQNGMPFMLPFSPDTIRWRRAAIVELRKLGIDV
jgi:hypothetical protein